MWNLFICVAYTSANRMVTREMREESYEKTAVTDILTNQGNGRDII